MTVQGYFDGTAVRPLEPVHLKVNQRVYINIPENDYEIEKRNARIQEKLDALHSVFGMLSPEESAAVDESIKRGIQLREVSL